MRGKHSARNSPVNPEKNEIEVANMTIFTKTFAYSNGTPIVSAIRSIVGLNDPNVLVLDYRRDEAAFKALWALDKNNVPTTELGKQLLDNLADANKTIILVDVDSSTVIASDKFGPHVSALDWAHAVYFALMQRKCHLPRIAILDLRDPKNEVMREYERFKPLGGVEYFLHTADGVDAFGEWLKHLSNGKAASEFLTSRDVKEKVNLAFKLWAVGVGHSNSRASHHEINNAAGPLALAASCPDGLRVKSKVLAAHLEQGRQTSSQHLSAAAMMRAFDWFREDQFQLNANTTQSQIASAYILIDDQYQHWSPILSATLGAEPISLINQEYDPARVIRALLDVIRDLIDSAGNVRRPLRGKLLFSTHLEILILDLRFFSREEGEIEKEVISQIVELAEYAIKKKSLCRKDIEPDLYAVKSWLLQLGLNGAIDTESNEYLRALTLLPQLLASLDDTYPIIMFSSTRQRLISDCLKPYDNIVQSLAKPSFFSYSESHLQQSFSAHLDEALLHAEKYLRLRKLLDKLNDFSKNSTLPSINPNSFIEIFFDEAEVSGRSWVQAALVVEYSTDDTLISKQVTQWMQNQTITLSDANGKILSGTIRWGQGYLDKKLRVDGTEHTRPTAATWPNLDKILAELKACSLVTSMHLITLNISKAELSSSSKRRGYIDGSDPNFYSTLRLLTECILYDILNNTNKVSLRYATRVLPSNTTERDNLVNNFGFSSREDFFKNTAGTLHRRILPSRVAHGIVDSCRQIRPEKLDPQIIFCDSRQLNPTSRFPSTEASSELHHLADLFATRTLDTNANIQNSLNLFNSKSVHFAETSYSALEAAARVSSKLQSARARNASTSDAWHHLINSNLGFSIPLGDIGKITVKRLFESLCELESYEISLLTK